MPRSARRSFESDFLSEITPFGRFAVPKTRLTMAILAVAGLALSACSGAGGGSGSGGGDTQTITALMVGNPQMEDIQKLTAENFTKSTASR